jgi:hypothetical protein
VPEIKVTKRQALDRFINERVMGERGFAIFSEVCDYRHKYNGGCEIGQYLPAEVAELLPRASLATVSPNRVIRAAAYGQIVKEMEDAGMEDPYSDFWCYLQAAHDNLALNHHKGDEEKDYWMAFLQKAAELC